MGLTPVALLLNSGCTLIRKELIKTGMLLKILIRNPARENFFLWFPERCGITLLHILPGPPRKYNLILIGCKSKFARDYFLLQYSVLVHFLQLDKNIPFPFFKNFQIHLFLVKI